MTDRQSTDGSNTIQLHIDQDELTIDQFTKSVGAFTRMIKALARDASDSVSWRISVESGSTCFNAVLVSDDEEAVPDVRPAYAVISDGVYALASGTGTDGVPESARKEYDNLVSAVGKTEDDLPAAKLVLRYDSTEDRREVPVEAHEGVTKTATNAFVAIGSVTGLLYNMTSRRGNSFTITNEETGLTVRGTYDDDLLDDFRKAFKTRATVSGVLKCDHDGRVKSIQAKSVRIEPRNVPRLSSLRGILEG